MKCKNCAVRRNQIVATVPILILGIAIFAISVGSTFGQSTTSSQSTSKDAEPQKQPGHPVSTVSVNVNVVMVLATVRDKHGKVVSNLNKDDFALTEDGRPQNIHYFTHENDLPLTLGLLVDTSLSQRRVLDQERSASRSFLDQMVREDTDKAFVIHFDREVELLQDLTPSHEKLEASLDSLQTPQFTQDPQNTPSSGPQSPRGSRRTWSGGGTLLYDAVYLASDELMKKQEGRKAVVELSDGVDRGSKESLATAIESAQRADTVVYSILFKDDEGQSSFGRPGWGGPGMGGGGMGRRGGGGQRYPREERPDGKKVLERISNETGGRLFEISKKQPIEEIYAQIEDELRHQYSLGYTPDRGSTAAEGYHKIQLTTKQKGLTVQTREGYYADR